MLLRLLFHTNFLISFLRFLKNIIPKIQVTTAVFARIC